MNYGQVLPLGWMCFCMVCLAVWLTVEFWSYDEKAILIMIDGTVLTILLGIIISIMNLV